MRKLGLAVALTLLCSLQAFAQTTTTVSGTIKDLSGQVVPTGQVTFELKPGIDTTIAGMARFTPSLVACTIAQSQYATLTRDGAGHVSAVFSVAQTFVVGDVVNVQGWSDSSFDGSFTLTTVADDLHATWAQAGSASTATGGYLSALRSAPGPSACAITQNTALTPSGTFYQVCLWPSFSRTACVTTYAYGTLMDLTSVVPVPGQSPSYVAPAYGSVLAVGGGGTGQVSLNGILKGNGGGPVTSAAVGDVLGLFSGACSGSTILLGNGVCGTPPNIFSQITLQGVSASLCLSGNSSMSCNASISSPTPGTLNIQTAGPLNFSGGVFNANGGIQIPSGQSLTLSGIPGTQCLQSVAGIISGTGVPCGTGGPGGGVSTFSGDGEFANNSGSTGPVTLSLANAGAFNIWGNNSSSTALPHYTPLSTWPPSAFPTLNQSTTGNAATATQLSAMPTACTLPLVATGVDAHGNATCSEPSNVTGNAGSASQFAVLPSQCSGSTPVASGVDIRGNANCTASTGTVALSSLTAAVGTNSINNGIGGQIWNFAFVNQFDRGLTLAENTAASTPGLQSAQALLTLQTLPNSTAEPLLVKRTTLPSNGFAVGAAADISCADPISVIGFGCVYIHNNGTTAGNPYLLQIVNGSGGGGNFTVDSQGNASASNSISAQTASLSVGLNGHPIPSGSSQLADISSSQTFSSKTISGLANTFSNVPLSGLAAQGADTVVGNFSGSSTSPTAGSLPTGGTNGCSGANNALGYSTVSHTFLCQLHVPVVGLNEVPKCTASNCATVAPLALNGPAGISGTTLALSDGADGLGPDVVYQNSPFITTPLLQTYFDMNTTTTPANPAPGFIRLYGGATLNCLTSSGGNCLPTGSGGGVSSFTGDGTLLNNAGSTGAVTAALANTGVGFGVWGNTGSSSGAPAYHALSSYPPAAFPTLNQSTTGNAATATALAATPAQCPTSFYSTGITAAGVANCASTSSVVTYTSSQTASTADMGRLVVMSCSSACAYTLPATQPNPNFFVRVMTIGTTTATISLGGGDTFNLGGTPPALTQFVSQLIYANSLISTDYKGDAPLVAGANVSLGPTANGLIVSSSLPESLPFIKPTVAGLALSSKYGTATGTYAQTDTALGVNFTDTANEGTNLQGSYMAYPGTAFTYTAVFAVMPSCDLSVSIGPIQSATGASEDLTQHCSGTDSPASDFDVEDWNNTSGSFGGIVVGSNISAPGGTVHVWMRYKDDGTNIYYLTSGDGVNWRRVYSVAKASGFMAGKYNDFGVVLAFYRNQNDTTWPAGVVMIGQSLTFP